MGGQDPDPAVGGVGDEDVAMLSTATPVGSSSSLAVPFRPSPLNPAVPVPATVTRTGAVPAAPGLVRLRPVAPPRAHSVDLLYPLRRRLGDVDVPVGVDGDAGRVAHRVRRAGRSSAAAAPAAGQDGDVTRPDPQPVDDAAVDGQDEDPAMTGVGDEEIAGRIEGDPGGRIQRLRAEERLYPGRHRRGCRRTGIRPRPGRHGHRRYERGHARRKEKQAPHPPHHAGCRRERPGTVAPIGAIVGAAAQTR